MADKLETGRSFTINSITRHILGNQADGVGGMLAVQAVDTSFTTGSVTVKGKVRGAPVAAFVPIPYKRRNLAGTVSDDTSVSAALTAAFMIIIDTAGLDIALDCTAVASGSLAIYTDPMQG